MRDSTHRTWPNLLAVSILGMVLAQMDISQLGLAKSTENFLQIAVLFALAGIIFAVGLMVGQLISEPNEAQEAISD